MDFKALILRKGYFKWGPCCTARCDKQRDKMCWECVLIRNQILMVAVFMKKEPRTII